MSQRRMPSGQGPARRRVRPAAGTGPRSPGEHTSAGRDGASTRPARGVAQTHAADDRRGTPRSGSIRRAAGPARRTKAPRGPRRLSGRAAAVGLLVLALMLAYAYPVRTYLTQQAQIDQMESAQEEQRKRIQELADRVAKWDDDDYVIAQARSRLQLVRKGELVYVVGVPPPAAGARADDPQATWYEQLWSNLQATDDPAGP